MKRIKARLLGQGTEEDPFRVNLPTYRMEGLPNYVEGWAWVLVPDDEVDKEGLIDEKRIREKYREHWAKFDVDTVKPLPWRPPPKRSLLDKVRALLGR